MGIYNFQKRFVPMILSGAKTQTIRARRRYPDRTGDMLHLYTGLRQKGAKLLKRARCIQIQRITITRRQCVLIDGDLLMADECDALAKLDGFESFADMMQFWDGRRPFVGQIIHWER
jgi:hypothetical protein